MSFSLSSVAGSSHLDTALSASGEASAGAGAGAGAALAAANAGPLPAAAESPPALIPPLRSSADGHSQLALSLSTHNRLQEFVQQRHPALLTVLESRFKRYHGLIYRLSSMLQPGLSAPQLEVVRRGIHQINQATWALARLLDQLPHPRIVPLLQSMARSVSAAGAWLMELNGLGDRAQGAHQTLISLDRLVCTMERAGTVDDCEAGLGQLNARMRRLHVHVSALAGRPPAARLAGQGQGHRQVHSPVPLGARQAPSSGAFSPPGRTAPAERSSGEGPSLPLPFWGDTHGAPDPGRDMHVRSPSGTSQPAVQPPGWHPPDAQRCCQDPAPAPDTRSTMTDAFFSHAEPHCQPSALLSWPLDAMHPASGPSTSRPVETSSPDPADWINDVWPAYWHPGDPDPGNE